MAHGPAGAETHFLVLQVIPGLGKQFVVACMVIVHVADDHVLHRGRIDADSLEAITNGTHHLPLPPGGHRRIEARIQHPAAAATHNAQT